MRLLQAFPLQGEEGAKQLKFGSTVMTMVSMMNRFAALLPSIISPAVTVNKRIATKGHFV